LIHFFGKNLQWLFAAVQFFSPTRFLVVVMTTFMLQIGFVNGVFAEDVTMTSISENIPVDVTTSYDVSTDTIVITAAGFSMDNVDKVFFDGTDITPLLSQLSDSGIAKTENSQLFFNVTLVGLNFSLNGEHELKFLLHNGTVISRKAETLALNSADKAGSYSYRTFVTLYENGSWSWSKKPATGKNTVTLILPGAAKQLDSYGSNIYAGEVWYSGNISSLANTIELHVLGCSISKTLRQKDFSKSGNRYYTTVSLYKGDMNCR
jgi:hypothetical protein